MDMMEIRRRLLQFEVLPPEYKRIQYMDSTNNTGQYINTLFVPDDNSYVECGFCFPTVKAYQCAFGSKGSQFSAVRRGSTNGFEVDICGAYVYITTPNLSNYTVMELSTNKVVVNGTETLLTKGTGQIDTPIFLFAKGFVNSTALDIKGSCRIWYAKIYQNNQLVRNFIPCIRKTDNKPGMYDTVFKNFYTNAGSGEFVVPS